MKSYKAKWMQVLNRIRTFLKRLKKYYGAFNEWVKAFDWLHIFVVLISVFASGFVFLFFGASSFCKIEPKLLLTNLLTINAIFSAVLLTYLFSRIAWSKERKLETFKQVTEYSQKITDFRRIARVLTERYQVWVHEDSTKRLLDYGKFEHIDFSDYKLNLSSVHDPDSKPLIDQLFEHKKFSNSHTVLYLALVSIVKDRKQEGFYYQEELYKDFHSPGIYTEEIIKEWIDVDIFGTIAYWLNHNYEFINYAALQAERQEYIKSAATRINEKYAGRDLDNKLIEDLADDFHSNYLRKLQNGLTELKKGASNLNLLILSLITVSLLAGVLLPFLLLIIPSKTVLYNLLVAFVVSLNVGFIMYLILRFPSMINRELKWL